METRNWTPIKQYEDILFDFYNGIARITINRPRYRNAFTPLTVSEISDALYHCRENSKRQNTRTCLNTHTDRYAQRVAH